MKRCLCSLILSLSLFISLSFALTPLSAAQSGVLQDSEPLQDNSLFNVIPDTAKKLDGAGLRSLFSDVTHKGQYRFLREATKTFAFVETTRADGTLTHRQGQEILSGIWNINSDQICYTYDQIWTYPVCFNIYKSGTCYYHLLRSSDGQPRYAVTARSTPSTQDPDCDALTS
ncbi:MAG: hypothetical protein ABJ275_10145 [Maricaulaceae bacterium]